MAAALAAKCRGLSVPHSTACHALPSTTLSKGLGCVPSPFMPISSHDCPPSLLDGATKLHGSHAPLLSSVRPQVQAGIAGFIDSWEASYSRSGGREVAVATNCTSHEAFSLFCSELTHKTGGTSHVTGIQILRMDHEGHASDVWLFRTPTFEEVDSQPTSTGALPGSIGMNQAMPQLLPCTWTVNEAALSAAAESWMHEVCSKASLNSLWHLAAPELQLVVSSGVKVHPQLFNGRIEVAGYLADQCNCLELGTRTPMSTAVMQGDNKVFMRWGQARTCRSSGEVAQIQGATVLVFNQMGLVAQVIDLAELPNPCPPPSAPEGRSAVMTDEENAAAWARQEQEWIAF